MRKTLNISCLLLVAAILFGQVGVGFLHDRHNAHETPAKSGDGQEAFQKHGEHCKVCAIDLFVNLFIETHEPAIAQVFFVTEIATLNPAEFSVYHSLCRDRAPPVVS